MHVIKAKNPHLALPELMYQINYRGVESPSRNGPVRRLPGPTTIQTHCPTERVIFWPERDANPFFHLLESLWMLAGREDVDFPASIVRRMADYSDDGKMLNAAYGYRWRRWFPPRNHNRCDPGRDQLRDIAVALTANPQCRRQVLGIWDPEHDLGLDSKDLPCNTHVYFSRDYDTGALDMTVCNRSNDAVWGALGSNTVHFSLLQEYMAAMIGCPVGCYWQVSNNMHLYLEVHADLMRELAQRAGPQQGALVDPYEQVRSVPLILNGETIADFDADLEHFFGAWDRNEHQIGEFPKKRTPQTHFFRVVTYPIYWAECAMKLRQDSDRCARALGILRAHMPGYCDWHSAALEWIERRQKK
jgi:thymidylate synthase